MTGVVADSQVNHGRRLVLATVTGLGARILSAGLGVVVAAVLARHLGPGDFGSLYLAITIGALATQFGDFGLTQTAVREMANDPESAAGTAGALFVVRSVLGGVGALIVITLACAGVLGAGADRWLVVLVALTIPFGGLASTVAVAQAKLRPEVLGILNLLQSLLWTTAVLGLVVFHSGTLGLAAGFVVTTAVSSVLSWVVSKRICAPLFSGWRRMAGLLLREGWMLGLMGVAVTAYYRLDAVLVYRIAGSAQAGLYAAAYRFLDVAQLLPGALLVPLLPLASRTLARGGHGEARRVFERVVIMALVISLPVAIGLSVHGAAFISLIYGQDFAQAAPVTAALGWAFVGVCFGWAGTTLTVAARRVRSLWPVAVGVAVASLVTHVVAIRWFGALGAGWVTAATELVIGLAALHIAGRAFGTAWPWDRLARVGLSGLVLALTAIFVRGLPLPIAIGLPGAAYLLALPGFGAVTSSELRQLLHGSSANAVSEG